MGVLPYAKLVVTHAGMGTVMASLACGVPMLCFPMERDQFANAERVMALDAGRSLGLDPTEAEIARAIEEVSTQEQIRVGCGRISEVVASYGGGERAVRELASLLSD
jgi:UDP:flavonoid glycosyltransferase YjiC (YdhE family)